MMQNRSATWIRIAFVNLLIVAILGCILRYKISFSLPFIDQKNLLHAHSHFAFNGWVSFMLMILIGQLLTAGYNKKMNGLLVLQFSISCLQLFSFAISGYNIVSISLSAISICIMLYFIIFATTAIRQSVQIVQPKWFYAAFAFNLLSTAGTFMLAYMMASKQLNQHIYLASVYWYLHFQYNGWFFFAGMGLLTQYLYNAYNYSLPPKVFYLFAFSCIPAYGLSVLWTKLPGILYALIVAGALAQLLGWIFLLIHLRNSGKLMNLRVFKWPDFLFYFPSAALTIKLILQAVSVIPSISQLAFGFRPVVIAYLHLVLLAVTSIFLICYCTITHNTPTLSKKFRYGALIFTAGVFFNEFLLAVQGIVSFTYNIVPGINLVLFIAALIIFTGALMMAMAFHQKTAPP